MQITRRGGGGGLRKGEEEEEGKTERGHRLDGNESSDRRSLSDVDLF